MDHDYWMFQLRSRKSAPKSSQIPPSPADTLHTAYCMHYMSEESMSLYGVIPDSSTSTVSHSISLDPADAWYVVAHSVAVW